MQAIREETTRTNQQTNQQVNKGKPAKHKAHTVQPQATPARQMSDGELAGWSVFGAVVVVGAMLSLALTVAVIRFVWKRATRKPVQPALRLVDHGNRVFSFEETRHE